MMHATRICAIHFFKPMRNAPVLQHTFRISIVDISTMRLCLRHVLLALLLPIATSARHLRSAAQEQQPPQEVVLLAGLRETNCPTSAPWCDYGCRCQTVQMVAVAGGNHSRIEWRTACASSAEQRREVVVDLQKEANDRWRCHSLANASSCGVYNATFPDLCTHVLGRENATTMQQNGLRTFVRIRRENDSASDDEQNHDLPEVWATSNDRQGMIAFQDLLLFCLHRSVPNVRLFTLFDINRCGLS
ncbi:hypothetical protein EBZ80_21130 [bacterium]|nr:hypothetical protein [bacterium]